MTAGIPCLGLSGLFVVLTAAVSPIWRFVRGEGNRVRPVRLRTVLSLTVAIAVATWITWYALSFVLGHASRSGGHGHANYGSFLGVPVIVVSLLMLLAIVGAAEVAARLLPHRSTPANPPIRRVQAERAGEPAVKPRRSENTSPAEPDAAHPTSHGAINSRRNDLATQRARLRTARETATVAWGTLLEQLDSNNEELRHFTRAITTIADLRSSERTTV